VHQDPRLARLHLDAQPTLAGRILVVVAAGGAATAAAPERVAAEAAAVERVVARPPPERIPDVAQAPEGRAVAGVVVRRVDVPRRVVPVAARAGGGAVAR